MLGELELESYQRFHRRSMLSEPLLTLPSTQWVEALLRVSALLHVELSGPGWVGGLQSGWRSWPGPGQGRSHLGFLPAPVLFSLYTLSGSWAATGHSRLFTGSGEGGNMVPPQHPVKAQSKGSMTRKYETKGVDLVLMCGDTPNPSTFCLPTLPAL